MILKKEELKNKYKSDFLLVKEAVNSFDPYRLIKEGATDDEYDFLTDIILSGIYSDKSIEELRKIVISGMITAFGPMIISSEHYKEIDEFLKETKKKIK